MALTAILFSIYLSRIDQIQRKNDPNRITNLKTALELEDLDFIKMVDELNLGFSETDLREVEKTIGTKMAKVVPESKNKSQRY